MVPRIQQQGFTLTELIAVIVILGVLAAVGLPRMFESNVFRERGYHDALMGTIAHARKAAVASRRFVCVNVDGAAGTVTLTRDPNLPDGAAAINCNGALNLPSTQSGCGANQLCVPNSVTVNGGAGSVNLFFDPLGRLVLQGSPRVVAADVSFAVTNQPNVTVVAATGHVQ
jgi:MSHA pilin protein MshC